MAHFDDVPLMCMCIGKVSALPSYLTASSLHSWDVKGEEKGNKKNQIWGLQAIDSIFDGLGLRYDPFLTESGSFVIMPGLLSMA